jgi:MFS family permease
LSEQNIARDSAAISADRAVPGAGGRFQVTATAFVVLFCIVGLALWGLPFYYDFMVRPFGWTRGQVTSGNAISKLVIGPAFGFFAGWLVDRFGPRRLMMAGVCMAGVALIGLGSISTLGMFYFFYLLNALGYVCGGPCPIKCYSRNGLTRTVARPWALPIWGSALAARPCRGFRTG